MPSCPMPALCLAALAFATGASHAADAALSEGLSFTHHDWTLACDNTRTCRAAGYQGADVDKLTVSVLLTRAAGPGTPVRAQLQLGNYGDDDPTPSQQQATLTLRMSVNGRALGTVTVSGRTLQADLSPSQTRALLDALPRRSDIQWSAKDRTWRLSDDGAHAVLLKMDEVQGRIGTPGALARKGERREQDVLPPLPEPVVQPAPIPPQAQGQKLLSAQALSQLLPSLKGNPDDDNCGGPMDDESHDNEALTLTRLSRTKLLVSRLCWRAAYNEGLGYWVINDKPPFNPELVTDMGSGFSEGRIYASQKGRGLGDCLSFDTWTWDGHAFVHTESGTTGLCRLITPGGAWSLPTRTTQVRPAGKRPGSP